MTWLKVSDEMFDHPKILEVGPLAACIHMWSLCYCARFLTDGRIPERALYGSPWGTKRDTLRGAAQRLEKAGLWIGYDGGWKINDYLEYNPSAADVREKRAKDASRIREWRAKHGKGGNAVTNNGRNDERTRSRPLSVSKETDVTALRAFVARVWDDYSLPAILEELTLSYKLSPAQAQALIDAEATKREPQPVEAHDAA